VDLGSTGGRPYKRLVKKLVFLVATVLAGCGSVPSPVSQLAASQGAVRAAEEAGADTVNPDAKLYLKLARENLAKGKEQMEAEDNERADRSLRKAEADADLARTIAKRTNALAAVEEALGKLQKLKPVTP
jgi:hypothetical protein